MKRKIQQWFIRRYSLVSTGTPWNLKHYEYLCLSNSVLVSREQSPELAYLGSQTGPHPGDGQNWIWSFWTRPSSNRILLQKALTVSWGGRRGCWQIDTQQRSIYSIWWRLPAWGTAFSTSWLQRGKQKIENCFFKLLSSLWLANFRDQRIFLIFLLDQRWRL